MVDDSSGAGLPPPADDAAGAAPAYPVRLDFDYPTRFNRFWAVPLIGFLAKTIILIPHFVVLYLIAIVVVLAQLVIWVPVLFTGVYPSWGYTLVGGFLGWAAELSSYFYGLTERYPAFKMRSPMEPAAGGEPVLLSLSPAGSAVRWMAIPLVGLVAKLVLLVPHLVVIYALNAVVSVILLLAWAPVLFTGAYPIWARELVTGYLRWSIRVQAYFYGLTDAYPPFKVDN